jgi:hypothetical protein
MDGKYFIAWLVAVPTIATVAMVSTPLPSGARESKEDCEGYAKGAVTMFNEMVAAGKKCAQKNEYLWHSNYKKHYDWCRNDAKEGWRLNEQNKRQDHLVKCGARKKVD